MTPAITGRLISSAFIRDVLPSLDGYHTPSPLERRRLDRWRDRVEETLGPASSARAIADVSTIPLLGLLGLAVCGRADRPGDTLVSTQCGPVRGPDVLIAGWNVPLAGAWRESVRSAIDADVRWTLATNGVSLRLVDGRRTWSREYLEIGLADPDVDGVIAAILWTCFSGEALRSDNVFLPGVIEQSEQHSAGVREALGRGVLDSLASLLEGFADTALAQRRRAPSTRAIREAVPFDQALTLVYRILFLLFAEARGLVPTWHPVYRERYSIGTMVATLLQGKGARGLWPALQAISRLTHAGCVAGDLQVNAFNGSLFAPSASATLDRRSFSNAAMTRVLTALGTVATRAGSRPLVYRDLDVEQLGSVYERVLDYEPTSGPAPAPLTRTGDLRKSSGSFYTPRPVTAHLVAATLAPLVEGRSADEILQLRILDPAMGSGAFLVSACRYLAARLEKALIRDGRWHADDATPGARGDLRREVASRCLYGVDVNPTAVQLARLSLWLATLAADKPLSFLDHRLVCGDSLVGAGFDDLCRQPPGARPRRHREHLPLFEHHDFHPTLQDAAKWRERLSAQPDSSPAVVREKGATLSARTGRDTPLGRWRSVLDLWCAGWFWTEATPLDRAVFSELVDVLLHDRRRLPAATTSPLLERAARIASARRFLHWTLTFPEVFTPDRPRGFDAILGNPPWDMVRGDSGGDGVRDTRRADARLLTGFVRDAGVYRVSAESHLNRYQLFVERSLQLVRPGGRIGLVLPSGVLTDAGTAPLRRLLFESADVDSVTGLDNRHAIFPIHRSVRFALTTCTAGTPTTAIGCRFGVTRCEDLDRPVPALAMSRALLTRLSGSDDLGVPEIAHALDLRIIEGVTARHPWLGSPEGWHLTFGRELNATDDRHRFRMARGGDDTARVLEGKHIEAFRIALHTCRFALRAGEPLPASARRARLVYRDIASAGNRMTLIAAIAPAHVVTTHTLFCLKTALPLDEQRVLCTLLNSFVANFLIRLRVTTHVTASRMARLPVPLVRRGHPQFERLLALARTLIDSPSPVEGLDEYVEVQALVARLYGLGEEEFARVLETFPLVERDLRDRVCEGFAAQGRATEAHGE
jgi:methylase of polypeptide subunit release factors